MMMKITYYKKRTQMAERVIEADLTKNELINWLENYPTQFRIEIMRSSINGPWTFTQWFFDENRSQPHSVHDPSFFNGLQRAKIVFDCYGKPVLDKEAHVGK